MDVISSRPANSFEEAGVFGMVQSKMRAEAGVPGKA
jgi:hypothetical protein